MKTCEKKNSYLLTCCISLLLISGCQGGNRPAYDSEIRALPLNTRVTTPELINRDAMIPFEHALPSQNLDGRHNGTYNNVELAIPGVLTTSDTDLGMMMKWLRDNVWSGRHTVFVDGEAIPVYKNWIRDHVHTMKAFRHWEYNLRAYLDFTLAYQRPDGSFYELIKQMDDSHWSYVAEDDVEFFPEDNLYLVRLDIESDVEYLVVEGAAEYYKATADRGWLRRNLPKLEKGIDYSISHPKRWDPELGLVKRAYTLAGVVLVLYSLYLGAFSESRKGIWFGGAGTVLVVMSVFFLAGFNGTAYYPSNTDLQSSLTLANSSSSFFTLKVMSYVSLLIPFVVAYIAYAWHAMDKEKITPGEIEGPSDKY